LSSGIRTHQTPIQKRIANSMELLTAIDEKPATLFMHNPKIMIVDDDPSLRQALMVRLRANQYRTVSAGDGYSALALAQKELPDLILLDLGLPGRETGIAVLKHLQEFPSLAPIPVFILTGWDSRDYKKLTLGSGAVAFFQKPTADAKLLEAIRVCLRAGNRNLSS
jgi:DNA-binding response OmpR family regulator